MIGWGTLWSVSALEGPGILKLRRLLLGEEVELLLQIEDDGFEEGIEDDGHEQDQDDENRKDQSIYRHEGGCILAII